VFIYKWDGDRVGGLPLFRQSHAIQSWQTDFRFYEFTTTPSNLRLDAGDYVLLWNAWAWSAYEPKAYVGSVADSYAGGHVVYYQHHQGPQPSSDPRPGADAALLALGPWNELPTRDFAFSMTIEPTLEPVPEPSSLILLTSGILALRVARFRGR
jgi:hypothetical protein